jgi:dTDP-4-dehydrorhamnose 3,5-epimerase
MLLTATRIPGVRILEPKVFEDGRGFFYESYNQRVLASHGIDITWVQDNHSRSSAGVLRGLHFQVGSSAQDKLVRVIAGAVFDVAVDLRRSSPQFGQWFGLELSAANRKMLLIPKGCAHGFSTLTDDTEFLYKCSAYYDPAAERGVAWNDPQLGIDWPAATRQTALLNRRDQQWPKLADVLSQDLFP